MQNVYIRKSCGDDRYSDLMRQESPLCVAVALLRRFAEVGFMIHNPVLSFNAEYRDSLSDGGMFLRCGTRFQAMTDDAFKHERQCVIKVADRLWGSSDPSTVEERHEKERSPEVVLARLLERDGYRSERHGSGYREQWHRHPLTLALVDAQHYLHEDVVCDCRFERVEAMQDLSDAPKWILRVRDRLFDGREAIPNPLATMRKLDDDAQQLFADEGEREAALHVLEDLSLQLWHLQTCVDVTLLMARLMLQADGGSVLLQRLGAYGSLLGVLNGQVDWGAAGGHAASRALRPGDGEPIADEIQRVGVAAARVE